MVTLLDSQLLCLLGYPASNYIHHPLCSSIPLKRMVVLLNRFLLSLAFLNNQVGHLLHQFEDLILLGFVDPFVLSFSFDLQPVLLIQC